jgi:putative phosphoesterase
MKIGLVSDTHGVFDPRLTELLAGVEAILHSGDVGPREILETLALIAPVYAVRGNTDSPLLNLSLVLRQRLGGVQIEVQHDLTVSRRDLEAWRRESRLSELQRGRRGRFLRSFDVATRVVIFGHSHDPCLVNLDGRLFCNPGSAGKQRFSLPRSCAVLEISPEIVEATILPLGSYDRPHMARMSLPLPGG